VSAERRRFKDIFEPVLARVDHGGAPATDTEGWEMLAALEAWTRNPSRAMPGELFIAERPPTREWVVRRFGLERLVEPLAEPAEPQAEPEHPAPVPRERGGKAYDADVVVALVRRAIDLVERPRRAVRDRWNREIPGATTPLAQHVLDLMDGKPLPPERREQWERATRVIAANGSVTRDELTQLLK
jgi:hypothetical protein